MLYHLLLPLGGPFNVIRYITFRSACAMVTALVLCYVAYPAFIEWMRKKKMEQIIRAEGPREHLENKVGTPTMGGVVMLGGLAISTLLWARLDEPLAWFVLTVTLGYGVIGFIDDWKKVMERSSDGLSGRYKILGQVLIGGLVFGGAYATDRMDATFHIPFYKHAVFDLANLWAGAPALLGWAYVGWGIFILTGTSNAVNLTDGLDGLAIGATITSAGTFAVLAYVAGHTEFAEYLRIPYVAGAGEVAIVAMALLGAGLGFLWFNCYPAQIFMGDVGALAIGGALGSIAVLVKQEILLALVGGVFVMETLSVMIQVLWFKRTGKRVFLMTPIHHHFEKAGWGEPKIIVRFWIISGLLALVALSTLKLR
ncbi:MAG: phospho-N-acetylmuramoyl-pentapeptide-transferase [Deltaproteobacteria bacterium]|nr:phospho-N-acetylmuramoyl-pentapeptide-transferase [Deltaproteobacteria bacterium]